MAGISIVVPVYNEQESIRDILFKVIEVASRNDWDYEVIVVDDGSSDRTVQELDQFLGKESVQIIRHRVNRGKGMAIRTALEVATKGLIIIQDADLEYDPSQFESLIPAMEEEGVDVVFGSRVLGAKEFGFKQRRNIFAMGVTVLNWIVRGVYGVKLTDEATCYKLFRTADLKRMELECERFEFCPEVTAKACRLGLKIKEVPITYMPRTKDEGKKIGWRDAVEAATTLWKYRRWKPAKQVSHAIEPVGQVELPALSETCQ